jgi:hypothetical protein
MPADRGGIALKFESGDGVESMRLRSRSRHWG